MSYFIHENQVTEIVSVVYAIKLYLKQIIFFNFIG